MKATPFFAVTAAGTHRAVDRLNRTTRLERTIEDLGVALGPHARQAPISACHSRGRTSAKTTQEEVRSLLDEV